MKSYELTFKKDINDLVAYIQTVPHNSNRYLWAKRLIEDLQVPNGKYIPIIANKQIELAKPIPVVYLGKVYPSIRSAASVLRIAESTLRHDILTRKFSHEVYILK